MTFSQNSYFNWSKYSMRSYFDICIPANPSFLARSAALDAAQLVALQSGCCTAVHPPAAQPSARAAEPVAQRWQEICASRQKTFSSFSFFVNVGSGSASPCAGASARIVGNFREFGPSYGKMPASFPKLFNQDASSSTSPSLRTRDP